jgi:hypothetical protein
MTNGGRLAASTWGMSNFCFLVGHHLKHNEANMNRKWNENMTEAELAAFMKEVDDLDKAMSDAAARDAKFQAENPPPEEWEDPSDYVGMGWVDSRGRP